MTLAYCGARYHGWQQQAFSPNWKGPRPQGALGPPTIQEIVRKALQTIVKHPVNLVGSSRTDTGVHAKGQVAHFDTHMTMIPVESIRRAVNSRTPDDILCKTIEPVDQSFNAILSTDRKRYQYLIWNHTDKPIFALERAWYRWRKMDVDAMREAAQYFVGTHDFTSFAKPGQPRPTTVRTMYECTVTHRDPHIVIGVTGSGFLWNMVRIMVGTLAEVGAGKIKPEDIPKILLSKDRYQAGPTAPAMGLYLQWIKYGATLHEDQDE